MKKSILLSCLSIFSSLVSLCQNSDKPYILGLSVDFYTESPIRITCDNFATSFNKILKVNAITQDDSIALFCAFVSKVKYAKNTRGIDVRCKFIYETDAAHTTTVCTDGYNILLNGRLIKRNKKFIRFLNSMIHMRLIN